MTGHDQRLGDPPYLVLRSRWRWKEILCAVIGGVCLLAFAFGELEGRLVHAVAIAAAAGIAAAAVRSLFLRIEVTQHEVRLANWFRVVRVPWADVRRFGADSTVYVETSRGRTDSAAFSVWRDSGGRSLAECRRVARRLEAARRQRRHEHGNPDR